VKHWPLCKKILKLLNKMLDDSYGVRWYKQAKVYCEQLNRHSGEERTIGGTVFSGVWLTLAMSENATHQDKNVVTTGGGCQYPSFFLLDLTPAPRNFHPTSPLCR
jgi:hypothetical protein